MKKRRVERRVEREAGEAHEDEGKAHEAQAGAQALLHRHSLEHDWVLCRTSGEWDLQVCADVPLAAWSAEPAAAEVRSALAEAARIAA
mgnify:CR=1 FL=1